VNAVTMIAVGIVVGVAASFTGLGGGFLVVPLLVLMGFPPQKAVGTSFVAILILSISAVLAHGKLQHVDWRLGFFLGLGGIAGAQVGTRLVEHVSGATFNRIFAVVLLGLAARMFFQK